LLKHLNRVGAGQIQSHAVFCQGRTILSAATINPLSLARVVSKIKFPSVQFQMQQQLKVFGRPYFGDSFSAKRRCFNDNARIK
jgi:hypothetical protein